jgi:hypothetical protein
MSLLLDRRPRSNRHLIWKIRLFSAAAVIALVGMYLDNPYVTGVALFLLILGMMLRLLPDRKQDSGPDSGSS